MTSYLLVVNPASGRGRARMRADALRAGLSGSHRVEIVETERRGFATDVVAERAPAFDRVIAIGGDGTLNEVLTGLLRLGTTPTETPALGFLPSGTANAAVHAFGLGTAPADVARSLAEAEARPVDVGVVTHAGTERPFLLWFGAGYDAVVIDALNRERTGLMGLAGLARRFPGVLRAVQAYAAPEITVQAEDRDADVAGSVIVANVGKMAFGVSVTEAADPWDGHLDLVTVPRIGIGRMAVLTARMMTSSLTGGRGVAHTTALRIRLDSPGDVPFQLDGEPVGTLPVEIRVAPAAIRLLRTS